MGLSGTSSSTSADSGFFASDQPLVSDGPTTQKKKEKEEEDQNKASRVLRTVVNTMLPSQLKLPVVRPQI